MSKNDDQQRGEPRMDFIADFTLKSLRLKPDKWARMVVFDEQRRFITEFIEKGLYHRFIIWKPFMFTLQ